jgi:predicted alpha/beta superfamily hydrolase
VFELIDPSSHRTYPIFVKLPRSYDRSKNKKYPVIYLTDAMYSFQVVSGATRFPMNSGVMQEAIIVGISYATEDIGTASRVRDYTPIKANSWKMKTGDAAKHVIFFQKTVFPNIEQKFRAKSVGRTFVGHSLGGLLGAYILLNHNTLFDNYIIGSPSVWFNNHYILSNENKPQSTSKRVYISVGQFEVPKFGERENMVSGAQALYQKLGGIMPKQNIRFRVIPEATHATSFPTTAIQGLYWLLKKHDKRD